MNLIAKFLREMSTSTFLRNYKIVLADEAYWFRDHKITPRKLILTKKISADFKGYRRATMLGVDIVLTKGPDELEILEVRLEENIAWVKVLCNGEDREEQNVSMIVC